MLTEAQRDKNAPMYTVSKQIHFCYGHRLVNYDGKCKHLHGHDVVAEFILGSNSLDHRGMVMDFNDIKNKLKAWIDEVIDHKMLLHKDDAMVKILSEQGEPLFLMDDNPTAENIAACLFKKAESFNFPIIEVKLWETPTSCASFKKA